MNPTRTSRARSTIVLIAVGVVAATLLTQPAGAAKAKTSWYTLTASPTSVTYRPGTSVTLTLTNCGQSVSAPTDCTATSGAGISSADLVLPSGWTTAPGPTTSAAGAIATTNGNVITVTGLKLAPGGSVGVTATVQPGLTNVNTALTVSAAIPSSATPTYVNATPNPTLTFPVRFEFSGQPRDGVTTAGSPNGALCPVVAQVRDSGGTDVPLAGVTVALVKASGTTLDPGITGTATTDTNGAAAFSSCPSAAPGGPYSIVASSSSPSISSLAGSQPFLVYNQLKQCNGACSLTPATGNGGTQVKVDSTTTGRLAEAALDATAPTFVTFSCSTNSDPVLAKTNNRPDVLQAVSSTTDAKTVTVTWSKTVTHNFTDTGTPHWEVCMRAPAPFTTDPGSPPAATTDNLWWVGLLPVCGTAGIPAGDPCMTVSRTAQSQEVAVISVPTGWAGDPYVH